MAAVRQLAKLLVQAACRKYNAWQVLRRTLLCAAVLEQQETATELQVTFDNSSDSEATVITLSGHDRPDLLHFITGAVGELSLNIVSANTRTLNEEAVITLKVTVKGDKVIHKGPCHSRASLHTYHNLRATDRAAEDILHYEQERPHSSICTCLLRANACSASAERRPACMPASRWDTARS